MRKITIFRRLLDITRAIRYHREDENISDARKWSNNELMKFAHLFDGKVLNISAGNDKDKEGRNYQEYFSSSTEYHISNYKQCMTSSSPRATIEHIIDLEEDLPSHLQREYDLVFSHTVLEHVFDIPKAVKNICLASKDCAISVVPWRQAYHHEFGLYDDYWRLSPKAMIRLFEIYSYKTIYLSWNESIEGNCYLFHIASRKPEKWPSISSEYDTSLKEGPGIKQHLFFQKVRKRRRRHGSKNTLIELCPSRQNQSSGEAAKK